MLLPRMQEMIQKGLESRSDQRNRFPTCRNLREVKEAFGGDKRRGYLICNVILRPQTALREEEILLTVF